MDNFDLKKFLVENKITPNSRLEENINEAIIKPSNTGLANNSTWMWKPDAKALGSVYYKEDSVDDDDFYYDKAKLIELIKSMNYGDAEEIANEIIHISSPGDDLEMFQNKYNKPDLKIEDITLDMIKQSIKDEF
jgi:hypothetical protein